ncbi:hypothetical protein [Nostoc sp. C052]|uniref:hypothetical protein n=1 Tax=Nostoc sp. C052 TaxID=2576902 RepID=UPI002118AD69|nr:hypothetical protein [Nostoc sp. C052]
MHIQAVKFRLIFAAKAQKQLDSLSPKDRKQYDKAFECFANNGATYPSLRTIDIVAKMANSGVLLHQWRNGFTGVIWRI